MESSWKSRAWIPAHRSLRAYVHPLRLILKLLVLQWWNDPDYAHGFFIPLFSGYLLWHQRALGPGESSPFGFW
jgi:hypothetical protein